MSGVDGILASLEARLVANVGPQYYCGADSLPTCGNKGVKSSVRRIRGDVVDDEGDDDEEFIISADDISKACVNENFSTADAYVNADSGNYVMESSRQRPRIFNAPVACPQDLHFTVPPVERQMKLGDNQRAVCVNGPHGPIMVELPQDAQPGEQRSWRLGPMGEQVTVPEGAEAGSKIDVVVAGDSIQAIVPPGKKPGDTFEVVPPAVVVMIPQGVEDGDFLEFQSMNSETLKVPAPTGLKPGQYFSILL